MAQLTEKEKVKIFDSLKSIESNLNDLNIVIRGKKDSPEPDGLIQSVLTNTKFRKIVTAWLWLLTAVTTGIVIENLFKLVG